MTTTSSGHQTAVRRRAADPRINLSSNEVLHPTVPDLVTALLQGWSPATLWRYPLQSGPIAAGARLWSRHPAQVLLTPGSDAAIRLLWRHLGHSRPCVVLQTPNYETWTAAPEARAGTLVPAPVRRPEEAVEAVARVARSVGPALVVVSWPNGPAGYTPPLAEVAALREQCRRRDQLLVVDACYAGFTTDPRLVVELADDSCLVLLTWSKLFGLAGGRLAALFGAASLLDGLRDHGIENMVGAPMIYVFQETAVAYDQFAAVWADIAAERERIRQVLTRAGHRVPASGGNFLHLQTTDQAASAALAARLSDGGYRVRDMVGVPGREGCVRFTVTCGAEGAGFLDLLSREAGRAPMSSVLSVPGVPKVASVSSATGPVSAT